MIHGDHSGENAQGSVEEMCGLRRSDSLAHTIPAAPPQARAQQLGMLAQADTGVMIVQKDNQPVVAFMQRVKP
jgi:hypothetical protein